MLGFTDYLSSEGVAVYPDNEFDFSKVLDDSLDHKVSIIGIEDGKSIDVKSVLQGDLYRVSMSFYNNGEFDHKDTGFVPMEDEYDSAVSEYERIINDYIEGAYVREDELSDKGYDLEGLKNGYDILSQNEAATDIQPPGDGIIETDETQVVIPDQSDAVQEGNVINSENDLSEEADNNIANEEPIEESNEVSYDILEKMAVLEKITPNRLELCNNGIITFLTSGKEPVFNRDDVTNIRSIEDGFGKVLGGKIDSSVSFSLNVGRGLNSSIAKYLEIPDNKVAYINIRQSVQPSSGLNRVEIDMDGEKIRFTPDIRLTTFEIQLKGEDKVYQAFLTDNLGRIHYEVPSGIERIIGVSNGEENGTMRFDFLDVTSRNYIESNQGAVNPFCDILKDDAGNPIKDNKGRYTILRDNEGLLIPRFDEEKLDKARNIIKDELDSQKNIICDEIYHSLEDKECRIEAAVNTQKALCDDCSDAYNNSAIEYHYAAGTILGKDIEIKDDPDFEGRMNITDIGEQLGRLNDVINEDDNPEAADSQEKVGKLLGYLSDAVENVKDVYTHVDLGNESKGFDEISRDYHLLRDNNDTAQTKLYGLNQELEMVRDLKSTPIDKINERFTSFIYMSDRLDLGTEKYSAPDSYEVKNDFKEMLVKEWNEIKGHENMQLFTDEKGHIFSEYGFRIDDADKNDSYKGVYNAIDFFDADRIENDDISETELFEKEDGSFDEQSVERYAETNITGTEFNYFDIRDLFMDFVGNGKSADELEKAERLEKPGELPEMVLSEIGGTTDYSEKLRNRVIDIFENNGFEAHKPVDIPIEKTNLTENVPMSKEDLENLVRSVDRHGAGRINMSKVDNEGKPIVELAGHIKDVPETAMHKLEQIAGSIMKIEDELSLFDQRYNNNPMITRQDKGYLMRVHTRDGLIRDYEKAGGKIGRDCFVTRGVTSADIFSSFVMAWRADPYLTAIYRVLSRDRYKELLNERKENVDKDRPDKVDEEPSAADYDDIKGKIENVLDGFDIVEDTFVKAVSEGSVSVDDISDMIKETIENKDFKDIDPENVAGLFNHAAEINEQPNKVYDSLNEALEGKVSDQFMDAVENCECEYMENINYENTDYGELLGVEFDDAGETVDCVGEQVDVDRVLTDISYDPDISSDDYVESEEADYNDTDKDSIDTQQDIESEDLVEKDYYEVPDEGYSEIGGIFE